MRQLLLVALSFAVSGEDGSAEANTSNNTFSRFF